MLLLCGVLAGCRADEGIAYSPHSNPEGQGCLSIAYLKSLCRSESSLIRTDCYIEGLITANDLYGEYPNGLVLEDRSGGIEVSVAGRELFRHYPIGRTLRIFCEGLALADYGGKVILGAAPTGEYPADRICSDERPLRLHLLEDAPRTPEPLTITISEASLRLVGRYVMLNKLRVAEGEKGLPWCERDSLTGEPIATTRHLVDRAGDTLDLYLPGSVIYNSEEIPSQEVRCAGILDYFNRRFQLRPVNRGIWVEEQ